MRVTRWIIRGVVGLLLVIVLLVGTVLAALQTRWAKDHIRRFAVDRANSALNAELSIGELGGSLFRGVELRRVALQQNGQPVFSADTVTVSYDPVVLIRQGLRLDDIRVEHGVVHVVETATGWNVTQLVKPRPATGNGPTAFSINRITMIDGDVTVAPRNATSRHLSEVELEASLKQDRAGLVTTLSRLSALDNGSGYRIERAAGTFEGAFANVAASFAASSGTSRVSGQVTGRRSASGRQFDGAFDLDQLNLTGLFNEPRWTTNITGHATMQAAMPSGSASRIGFTFAGPRASAFDYQGEDIDVTGDWSDGRLSFRGKTSGYGTAATIDAAWQFTEVPDKASGFTGTGTFAHADLRRLPAQLSVIPRFASSLNGRFNLRYSARGWQADTTLASSTFEDATLAAGTIGHVRAEGAVVSYSADGRITNLNVRRLAGPLEIPLLDDARFETRLNGPFTAEGSGTDPKRRHLAATVTLEDSRVADATFGTADATLALDGQRLDIGVNGDFAHVTSLVAGLPTNVVIDLTGRADARMVIDDLSAPFTLDRLNVAGQVQLSESTVQGVPLTKAAIDADLANGIATIREMNAEGRGLVATARGTAAVGSTGESLLDVHIVTDDLKALGAQISQPLSGSADLTAQVTGPADRPVATGTLNGQTLAYGDTAKALTLNSAFTAEVPERDISRATVKGSIESTFLQLSGQELVSARTTIDYANQQVAVEGHLEQPDRAVDLAGVVAFGEDGRDVTLRRLEVASAGAVWALPAGREAHVRIEPTLVRVEGLAFSHGEGLIDITGALPLVEEAVSPQNVLKVQATNVQVADVNQLLLGTRKLAGVINAQGTVGGFMKAPTVDANLAVTAGAVEDVQFDALRADVKYKGDRATIDAALDQTATNRLTAVGTLPIASGGAPSTAKLELRVKSTPIDLGLAQAFTKEVSAIGGVGVIDMTVTGSLQDPILDGGVQIDNGTFTVEGTGVTYSNATARIVFEQNHLQIGQFQLQDEDGHLLKAVGALDVFGRSAQGALDLKITAEQFHMLDSRLGNVQMNVDMTLAGDVAHPRISGMLRVDQGRIDVGQVLEVTTKSVYSTRPQAAEDDPDAPPPDPNDGGPTLAEATPQRPKAPTPSLFDRLDLDLQVRLPDNLVLRGRDLRASGSSMGLGDINIVAGGTLSLKKPIGAPTTIVGEMAIVRGYYSFQGRRFDVQRDSVVRFRGQSPIDPQIDITADREISGVMTSVNVKGSASRPGIDFSSNPSLDDADVLSLIVFGQSVNDLGGTQRTSLSEKAASMAAGAIATPLADSVARALNLDLFEIQAPSDSSSSPVVSAGSQIGTRLYVGVRQEIGKGDTSSAVSVEYRIASFLRLVTSIAQGAAQKQTTSRDEAGGIDLMFVFRY